MKETIKVTSNSELEFRIAERFKELRETNKTWLLADNEEHNINLK